MLPCSRITSAGPRQRVTVMRGKCPQQRTGFVDDATGTSRWAPRDAADLTSLENT